MASRGQLEDVESAHVASLHTWQVPGSLSHLLRVVSVDNQRAFSQYIPRVPVFTSALSYFLRVSHLEKIIAHSEALQSGQQTLCASLVETIEHQRQFGNTFDLVASCHDQRDTG